MVNSNSSKQPYNEAAKRSERGTVYDQSLSRQTVLSFMDYVPNGLKSIMRFKMAGIANDKYVDAQYGIKPRFLYEDLKNMSPADKIEAFDYIMKIITDDTPKWNADTTAMTARLGFFIAMDANEKARVGAKPTAKAAKNEEVWG